MRKPKPRPPIIYGDFTAAMARGEHQRANRVLFEWLSDDANRAEFFRQTTTPLRVPSRVRHEDDPAPPVSAPPLQGHDEVWLVTDRRDIDYVLTNARNEFSNAPYRLLGTGTFMLGMDKPAAGGVDWHGRQNATATEALKTVTDADRGTLIKLAFEQAAVISLARKQFDAAELAEQAALRFCGLLFGFASADHALLEDVLRKGYRALTYLNLGRHFLSEPATAPAAREAMARLMKRADELLREYDRLARYPEDPPPPYAPNPKRHEWPAGVTPPSDYGLTGLVPLLKQWSAHTGELSGEQLAVMAVGMLVGIVGNVQASVCIAVEHFLSKGLSHQGQLQTQVQQALRLNPPVPFLPRLVMSKNVSLPSNAVLPANAQVILCIGAATNTEQQQGLDPLIYGGAGGMHWCIGKHLAQPLVEYIVREVLHLPGLAQRLDPVTGEPLGLAKRWGFACESYPLEYRRDRRLAQQPLQVIMRIKSPVADNAAKLRRLIRDGAPKIERALRDARHVHFAWFQLIEGDTQLALQTVYDGDFDAYIQHFALKVDDVFDQVFQCIEDAPPLPVSDFPDAFVETIRRFNRAPAAGYFFSAYPHDEVWNIVRQGKSPR